jgi:Chlamydia-phage Chp2 scaffold (Chlamy_scaf).
MSTQKIPFRTAYGPRRVSKIMFLDKNGEPEVTKTVQSEKDRTEINNVIRRYNKTGLIDHVAKGRAMYGDFTEINEYQENLNMIMKAEASFAALPSEIRKKFDNDPGQFFEFATNPENEQKLVEMGLAHVKTPPAPTRVEIVNKEPEGDDSGDKAD